MQQFNNGEALTESNHIKNFQRWLKLLNYAESTIYGDPIKIKYLLDYLETIQIRTIQEIENQHIKQYYEYLKVRPSKNKVGALSQNYIISNINAIKRFTKYLRETELINLTINIKPERVKTEKIILTKAEVKALYKACENDILGQRDQAMLNIYYGTGLRRTEGVELNTEDILFNKSMIFIKNGKGNQQRYIPMNKQVKLNIENYINTTRNYLKKGEEEKALFLNKAGKRISGNGMITRLKLLTKKAKITKQIGLHTLRHSIATHLLNSGMTLENVSQFLGHQSLESTQIYTHLSND